MAAVGQSPPSIVRLKGLDGLRGVALLGILAFHAGVLPGGFLAVDTFFALSGFLITTLLLKESDASANGTIDLGRFWRRRLRRLAPGLLALLGGLALVALVVGGTGPLGGSRGSALATFTYLSNWYAIAVGQGYWDQFTTPSPLAHTWTLAVEEQFYLLWPAILAMVLWAVRGVPSPRRRRRLMFGFCLIGAVASAGWMAWLYVPDDEPSRVYLGTDTRSYALLLGAALATWRFGHGPNDTDLPDAPKLRRIPNGFDLVSMSALALILVSWWLAQGVSPWLYRGGMPLLALPAVLLVAAAARPASLVTRLLSVRPLRWLGRISYGAYLWHWPWFIAVRTRWPELALPLRVGVQSAGALVAGAVSFVLIERPFHARGVRAWGAPTRALAGVAVTVALLVVATTPGGGGRPAAPSVDAALFTPIPLLGATAGTGNTQFTGPQLVGTQPQTPRVLIVGDSLGYRLGEELMRSAQSRQLVALNRATPGCFLGRGTGRVRYQGTVIEQEPAVCATWANRWEEDVAAFDPDLVLVITGNAGDGEREFDGEWHAACADPFRRWLTAELAEATAVLGAGGAVVVITTVPYPRFPFLDRSLDHSTDCMNRIITSAPASTDARERVVDLAGWVCPSVDSCVAVIDGDRLRPDGVHFEGAGAARVLDWLLLEAGGQP